MMKIAVLDKFARLRGYEDLKEGEEVPEGAVTVPDAVDLPTDGTYKWDKEAEAFFKLGTGFGKIRNRQPISNERVLYLLVKESGSEDRELIAFKEWYESSLKKKEEEIILMKGLN